MSRELVANLRVKKHDTDGFTVEKLEAAIERGYEAQKRPDEFITKKTFAPSSIGGYQGVCPRYWYQAFNGADFVSKTDSVGVASMLNGTAGHERLEKVLEDGGVLVSKEIEMKLSDPPIRGYIDVIVNIDGEDAVGEIKTTLSEGFMWRRSTMKPSAQHLYQILIYMYALDMEKGFMLYENKNDNTLLTIPVKMTPRNKKILEDALDWLRRVYANWEAGEGTDSHLPKRPWTKKNKICRGCPLFEKCWVDPKAKEGTVEIPPMEPAKP
jgi:CRISPR/Cas system-associated exonuclease Cas4 (RecB family)